MSMGPCHQTGIKINFWISLPQLHWIKAHKIRVVEWFFFLYIFRRAKLQIYFFSPGVWVSGHCSSFCTSCNMILLVFPSDCNKKQRGCYRLASRSAKSYYSLYYIQMWSGGNERLYSAEGMDFHSSASVCTHLHLCSHIQWHQLVEEPQNKHKKLQKLCAILTQEEILGHVGVRLFKGLPKMSKR